MTGDPEGVAARPFPRERLLETLPAARAILGARLVREPGPGATERRVGRIVEVEAYIGEDDLASHARMGRTSRNAIMYGPPGRAYVYLVYGMYDCLNITTEAAPRPAALLVRALEPLEGVEAMRASRAAFPARRRSARSAERDRCGSAANDRVAAIPAARLAAGPGLLAAAFDIDRALTGLDLCDPASPLRLELAPAGEPAVEIRAGPRIGVAYAAEPWASIPWRFTVAGSPSLSGRAGDR